LTQNSAWSPRPTGTPRLRPARRHLQAPLAAYFRGKAQEPTERAIATSILADFAADDPPRLADLVKNADAGQYARLIGKLEAHRAEAEADMRAELARRPRLRQTGTGWPSGRPTPRSPCSGWGSAT
jgi:hypothetical protein